MRIRGLWLENGGRNASMSGLRRCSASAAGKSDNALTLLVENFLAIHSF
jgi:hypothetical protein